jgi:hypothetical protein
MILHDENHAYFAALSKNKKLDKSAFKKLGYRTKKNHLHPWGQAHTLADTGSEDPISVSGNQDYILYDFFFQQIF